MQSRIDVFDSIHKDEMFNNEGWRRGFVGPRHRWAETGKPPNDYRPGDCGTLYHDYGDETGHFMAFEVFSFHVLLMDPSGTAGPYGPDPEELQLQLDQFPKRNVRYVYGALGPQHRAADTLCQTWSLAWLMRREYPEMERILASAVSTQVPVQEMTDILDIFRTILLRPPYTRNDKAIAWLSAYRDVRLYLEEYFWATVPKSVTRPHSVAMRELRGE